MEYIDLLLVQIDGTSTMDAYSVVTAPGFSHIENNARIKFTYPDDILTEITGTVYNSITVADGGEVYNFIIDMVPVVYRIKSILKEKEVKWNE